MLRALSETDQRDIGSLPGGYGSDVLDVDLAGDHLVPEVCDDRGAEREPFLALVGVSTGDANTRYLRLLQGPPTAACTRWV
jgi:hypothetical protein